jgi:hypothetical protein
MPPIDDWLRRSWERFARRWWVLLASSGTATAAAMLAAFVPVLGAVYAASLGRWSPWTVWGVSLVASALLALWLSTWAQVAALEAAGGEEEVRECLRASWAKTAPFAWTLSLMLLACGGGYFLLVLPGLWLTPLLFAAPFITLQEGVPGLEALELSWRRSAGRWGALSGRLALAGAIPFLIGLIPFVGWLLGMVAGPFSLVMLVVLAEDLRAADPGTAAPAPRLALPVAALSVAFVVGTAFTVKAALLAAASLKELLAAQGAMLR